MSRKKVVPGMVECVVEGCNRPASGSRELCNPCYTVANSLVKSNQTTWEELESLGLCGKVPFGRSRNILKQKFLEAKDRANKPTDSCPPQSSDSQPRPSKKKPNILAIADVKAAAKSKRPGVKAS